APLTGAPAPEQLWKIPVQLRVDAAGRQATQRVLLEAREQRVSLPAGFAAVVGNAGGHGVYLARDAPALLEGVGPGPGTRRAIERFNLVNDAWAATLAGLMSATEYLELTARFRDERDRNVWSAIVGALHSLNRVIAPAQRPGLESLVRDRLGPAVEALGWTP